MRRTLIRDLLPLLFCSLPILAGVLIAVALPRDARDFYLKNLSNLDRLILGLGTVLFLVQTFLSWRALRWQDTGFDERADAWLSNLAQAAEWFPLLGLLGTVAGIIQTFQSFAGNQPSTGDIIARYAPALTATGSGLLMALVNIFPTWVVIVGRDLILALGGGGPARPDEARTGPAYNPDRRPPGEVPREVAR